MTHQQYTQTRDSLVVNAPPISSILYTHPHQQYTHPPLVVYTPPLVVYAPPPMVVYASLPMNSISTPSNGSIRIPPHEQYKHPLQWQYTHPSSIGSIRNLHSFFLEFQALKENNNFIHTHIYNNIKVIQKIAYFSFYSTYFSMHILNLQSFFSFYNVLKIIFPSNVTKKKDNSFVALY